MTGQLRKVRSCPAQSSEASKDICFPKISFWGEGSARMESPDPELGKAYLDELAAVLLEIESLPLVNSV